MSRVVAQRLFEESSRLSKVAKDVADVTTISEKLELFRTKPICSIEICYMEDMYKKTHEFTFTPEESSALLEALEMILGPRIRHIIEAAEELLPTQMEQ